MFTSGTISRASRTGLVLVAISFLLSLVPFQGKSLTSSKERTSAQTEVVIKSRTSQKRAILFSFVASAQSALFVVPFSSLIAEVHSLESEQQIKDLRKHVIPDKKRNQLKSIFVAETEDHIA